jgi:adenylate cyclase
MTVDARELAIAFARVRRDHGTLWRLGDERGWDRVADCLERVREAVERQGGRMVKTITGDTGMCVLGDGEAAVRSAIVTQKRVLEASAVDEHGFSVGIGIALGSVVYRDEDYFGRTVNLAARFAAAAKGGQIFVSQATAESLPAPLSAVTRLVDHMPMKGIRGLVEVHEVVWEQGTTGISEDRLATSPEGGRLYLRHRGRERRLEGEGEVLVVGRGKDADFRVPDGYASRVHLRLECRRGSFVATDQSVNGTWVHGPSGSVHLRRGESTLLMGIGRITLGRAHDPAAEEVEFQVEP